MKRIAFAGVIAIMALCANAAQATPVLITNSSGVLTGVDDLVVSTSFTGTSLYNVTFVPSEACTTIFSPCASAGDFPLTNTFTAQAGANALVTLLTNSGFKNDPAGIFGYSPSSSGINLLIPYALTTDPTCSGSPCIVLYKDVIVTASAISTGTTVFLSRSAVLTPGSVFANFSFTPIPEPISISLFGAGLLGAIAARRRNAAKG